MKTRERYYCEHCGLRIEGVQKPDGLVYPSKRPSPSSDEPAKPVICLACHEAERKGEAL